MPVREGSGGGGDFVVGEVALIVGVGGGEASCMGVSEA